MKKLIVAIIGLGRFGELLHDELVRHSLQQSFGIDLDIVAVTSRPEEYPDINTVDLDEAAAADLIIPCVPISIFEQTIKDLVAAEINPRAVVMDVCSVKVKPIEIMQQYLPDSVQILATHPIFGPDSVKLNEGSLSGLPIVIYAARTSPTTDSMMMKLLEVTGLRGIQLTPEQHDKKMAWSLLYFQLVGRMGHRAGVADTGINTVGFSKLLELQENYAMNDSWQLFEDMYNYNPFAKEMLEKVKESLISIEDDLMQGKEKELPVIDHQSA